LCPTGLDGLLALNESKFVIDIQTAKCNRYLESSSFSYAIANVAV